MDISLVIPCYNEAPHLRQSVRALCEILDATTYDYEIFVVDDVSRDETRAVIEEICASTPRCRYIFHQILTAVQKVLEILINQLCGRIRT